MKTRESRFVRSILIIMPLAVLALVVAAWAQDKHHLGAITTHPSMIGKEVAVPVHLQDGQEFTVSFAKLLQVGEELFKANFTIQEGEGRPLTKGTGAGLTDTTSPLVFPRNFNRISEPSANSCFGCHNEPRDGGGGDRVTEVFVLGQRFDFMTFDHSDSIVTRGAVDEIGNFITMTSGAFNERKTIGMFGSGYVEMLSRQMTADLQAERDATPAGSSVALSTHGVSFGTLTHNSDNTWDVSQVQGLVAPSLGHGTDSSGNPIKPSLIIRPFHQASNVVSIRQFTNNAFNHHHGMQAEERFGLNTDPDGDGFINELTTADVTAISMYQATLEVPGQVIPNIPAVQAAVAAGQSLFSSIGCASCHANLVLTNNNNPGLPAGTPGWIYSEPNPYNPIKGGAAPNLTPGPVNYPVTAPPLTVDLTSSSLPQPRLVPDASGNITVPALTDLKVHDITCSSTQGGAGQCKFPDPNAEQLDQNQPAFTSTGAGNPAFFAGNTRFITRKLWGLYNTGPFFHHGQFTTMREAIENHNGEAISARQAFDALSDSDKNNVIEYLKSLRVLPAGTTDLAVDEHLRPTSLPKAH